MRGVKKIAGNRASGQKHGLPPIKAPERPALNRRHRAALRSLHC
jgi:hypothetical protein